MNRNILKILKFNIYGKFAHFRKFYTNSSSLSYLVPPRTVITGMLASIMEYERDSYYDLFSPEKIKISVAISPGTAIKKQMQSMNYMHFKYHNFLSKGTGEIKKLNMHSQCKLELLMARKGRIGYTIYVSAIIEDSVKFIDEIEKRLLEGNLGYGVYLGQRQFIARVDNVQSYEVNKNHFMESSDHIDSICLEENISSIASDSNDVHMVIDQMPVQMISKQQGRELQIVKRVLFEQSGKKISGLFKNCYKVGEKIISFYEG
jgi:CRISPR-associated protein Cas5h